MVLSKTQRVAALAVGGLIVVGVVLVLVVPRISSGGDQAKIAATNADLANIAVALARFKAVNGRFPSAAEGLQALLADPPAGTRWTGPYLKGRTSVPEDPWGNAYRYQAPGKHNADYDVWSSGRDGKDATEDDIVNWQ